MERTTQQCIEDYEKLLKDVGMFLGRAKFGNEQDLNQAMRLRNAIADKLQFYSAPIEHSNDTSINQEF